MLRDLLDKWPSEVTIVPYSGIQFLDFGLDIDGISKGNMEFSERREPKADTDTWRLIPHVEDGPEIPEARVEGEEDYSVSKAKALEPFLNKWTPLPVLRLHLGRGPNGEEIFDGGPSTWARVYLTELDTRDADTGHTHRVVIALDTDLEDEEEADDDYYLAPTTKDAEDQREFRLASDPGQNAWFLRRPMPDGAGGEIDQQKWVDDWLQEHFTALKRAQRPGREPRPEDFPYRFEHWARFLAMVRLLGLAIDFPRLRLVDTISDERRYQCVDVDLVLDVGNSRTCGILVESYPDDNRIDLNNSYALAMRDLGAPELYARRPFESRVEFAEASFGPDHVARRSGRARPAFLWPSMVRVGVEAQRLVRESQGTETVSGISSPKRYIWDTTPVTQNWRFNGGEGRQTLPLIVRSSFRFLNETGDVIEQIQTEEDARVRRRGEASKASAIHPKFSRSSLYGFMLSELISHAICQINDAAGRATRKQSDLPRRLKNIILTLPSATPIQEQAIMRSRAEGALRLVWSIMGWKGIGAATTQRPNVIIDWDEASCTQLVWLYDEIAMRFGGQINAFLDLKGKARRRPAGVASPTYRAATVAPVPEPSLRIGCIDIGGGTTDLMVTTYYAEDNRALMPVQNVREGFRIAGDDLVAEVVSRIVIPQLRDQLELAGAAYAEELLRELFSGDVGDIAEQTRQRRRQFALQVLTPIALAVLGASEQMGTGASRVVALADALPQLPPEPQADPDTAPLVRLAVSQDVLGYLERPAADRGADGFAIATTEITVNANDVDD
ncbi:MAG: virulence factor SrfB, partial [Pseudomonadota bacterium]